MSCTSWVLGIIWCQKAWKVEPCHSKIIPFFLVFFNLGLSPLGLKSTICWHSCLGWFFFLLKYNHWRQSHSTLLSSGKLLLRSIDIPVASLPRNYFSVSMQLDWLAHRRKDAKGISQPLFHLKIFTCSCPYDPGSLPDFCLFIAIYYAPQIQARAQ